MSGRRVYRSGVALRSDSRPERHQMGVEFMMRRRTEGRPRRGGVFGIILLVLALLAVAAALAEAAAASSFADVCGTLTRAGSFAFGGGG